MNIIRCASPIRQTFRPLSLLLRTKPAAFIRRAKMTLDSSATSGSPSVLKVTTRSSYQSDDALTPITVLPSPIDQFKAWFKSAQEDPRVFEPETMTLATASADGTPSARIVLLKSIDERGFVLYTNYTSRKSNELKLNPRAALTFYWREQHRQVRVVGRAEMVDRRESEEYFQTRPVGSRIGAWASRQSTAVAEGAVQERLVKLEKRFGVKDSSGGEMGDEKPQIPLPEFWGGWRIIPE
jgi:pyridoxamine-phosphate oxidase